MNQNVETHAYSVFQGAIKIYKTPLPKDLDDHTVMGFDPQFGFFQVRNILLFFCQIVKLTAAFLSRRPGPALQRPPPRPRPRLRGQGQRPPPDGHQRQGRPLPRPQPRFEEGHRQGQLRLQTAEPRLRKVSLEKSVDILI